MIKVSEDGKWVEMLRYAIVCRAITDYNLALKWLHSSKPSAKDYPRYLNLKKECERFFRSSWYSQLCDIDGEKLMRTIRTMFYNKTLKIE